MSQSGSISQRLEELRRGDAGALGRICDRYYEQLAVVARRKLTGFARRVADEFAIANEVLQEFHERMLDGDFDNVTNRTDLFPLLIRLTHDKVIDEIRRLGAQKRGGGRTRGNSIFVQNGEQLAGDFDRVRGVFESPSTRQIVIDQLQSLLQRLPDETMRAVFLLRAEGYTNDEIARELKISVATVERKRRRIKDLLDDLDEVSNA
jgi:RNA polymerase sigma factor (sigma-70 family)